MQMCTTGAHAALHPGCGGNRQSSVLRVCNRVHAVQKDRGPGGATSRGAGLNLTCLTAFPPPS